jgi:hypothetical protein
MRSVRLVASPPDILTKATPLSGIYRLTGLSARYCAAAQALVEGVEGNNLADPRSEHSILKCLHEGSQMLYEVLWMNVAT